MNNTPVPPHYEPDQIAAMHLHDILQRQQPATPATWIVGIVLVVAAIAWVTLTVTRLHHTSAGPPDFVTVTEAPQSSAPAR